jgi:chemotaxis protein CheD
MYAIRKIQICGGDCRVSESERDIFATVLGSCITACIYDPVAGLGGMNHYVLPHNNGEMPNTRYGDDAMPRLLKLLHMRGAVRERLVAKVYGGARILSADADIGRMNIDFIERFLREAGIPIVDGDVGGRLARWVDFHPRTGRALVRTAASRTRPAPDVLETALALSPERPSPKRARAGA